MAIITGYVCLVALLFLLLKFVTKRVGFKRANLFMMKYHKYAALGFIVAGIVHLFLVLKVLDTRSIVVTVSGIVIIVAGIALVILCHVLKNRKVEIMFHRGLSVIMLVFLTVHVVAYFVDYNSYKVKINEISIEGIDLKTVSDGKYEGEYDTGYISARVRVTVSNNRITEVEILEHKNERGGPAEVIVDDMVKENRIDVDAVSGATNSSKVLMKACENAFNKN